MKIVSVVLTGTLAFLECSQVSSQDLNFGLKSIEGYVTDISRTSNNATFQSNLSIRKTLKGDLYTIPTDWRLVSVISDRKSDGSNEFVLFFQDSHATVHSIGVSSSGNLTGNNMLTIQAKTGMPPNQ
jgi:hypothetical protein